MARRSRIRNVDHLVISVSDFERSRRFYGSLFRFLGMKVLDEYEGAIGWKNGGSRFWIYRADVKGRGRRHRIGDVGYHHYAFSLRSRKDVDDLQDFLKKIGAKIVDPASEYYDNYYAVYFRDPDGLKLEAMHWGRKQRARGRTRERESVSKISTEQYEHASELYGTARVLSERSGPAPRLPAHPGN